MFEDQVLDEPKEDVEIDREFYDSLAMFEYHN